MVLQYRLRLASRVVFDRLTGGASPDGDLQFEQGIDLLAEFGALHPAQRSDQFQVLPTAQVRIEMRLLRNVTEKLAVRCQVFLNVVTVELDHAAGRLQQSREIGRAWR